MKQNSIFWIGFTDLMTGLFFIMLVLFIVVFVHLAEQLEVSQGELKKIRELEKAVKELPQDYFEYNEVYRRSSLKRDIQFDIGKSEITKDSDRIYLINAGKRLQNKINELNKRFNIKYLLVIEGMASRTRDNYKRNYELSYDRALALYRLWESNGINLDKAKCEIQIAGSGTGGIREYSGINERKNQRFKIHILPKTGKISDNN